MWVTVITSVELYLRSSRVATPFCLANAQRFADDEQAGAASWADVVGVRSRKGELNEPAAAARGAVIRYWDFGVPDGVGSADIARSAHARRRILRGSVTDRPSQRSSFGFVDDAGVRAHHRSRT
jgi:hypothetical protein